MSQWRLAMLLLAGAAYAGLSHWMMLHHAAAPWALAVLLGPLWLTVLGLAASRFGARGTVLAAAAGVVAIVLVSRGEAGDPNRLYVLQHVGINVMLCAWFGGSLRGERSLIGEFAARVHPMTADQWAYGAQVTKIWTAYFALMAAASVIVYLALPFEAWSLLANVLTPLLIAALFLGEHFLRYRLHPEFERARLADVVRAFRNVRPDNAIHR
jgi:uncharacterized membrane protein